MILSLWFKFRCYPVKCLHPKLVYHSRGRIHSGTGYCKTKHKFAILSQIQKNVLKAFPSVCLSKNPSFYLRARERGEKKSKSLLLPVSEENGYIGTQRYLKSLETESIKRMILGITYFNFLIPRGMMWVFKLRFSSAVNHNENTHDGAVN